MVADKSELKTPVHVGRTKEYFWRKMLTRFAESGLSQTDFCRREGLNPGKFSWWKREIRLRDEESQELKKVAEKDVTEAQWRRMIVKFNRSGLSKDVFCEREGIKPQAFVWWRGEINRRDNEKRQAVAQPLDSTTEAFVPVKVIPGEDSMHLPLQESSTDAEMYAIFESARKAPAAELCFGEVSIRIWRGAEKETVCMLIQALKENYLC